MQQTEGVKSLRVCTGRAGRPGVGRGQDLVSSSCPVPLYSPPLPPLGCRGVCVCECAHMRS